MTRLAHVLVAATYGLGALVLGAALFRLTAIGPVAAWTLAGFALIAATQIHASWLERDERRRIEADVRSVARAGRALEARIDEAETRFEDIEARLDAERQARHDSLASEVKTLEGLVRDLGVAMHSRMVSAQTSPTGADTRVASKADRLGAVRDALEHGRVDLHLQPIVSLPQRKPYYYESFTRLRDEDDRLIMPNEWFALAEQAGLLTAVDNILLFRCVQIVRKLSQRDRRVGIFCNVSPGSLGDETFFPQFLDFMRRNSDLAGALIFEMGARAFEERSPTAARNMSRLAEYGFRFSLDKVDALDLDLEELRRASVRFVKIPGMLLASALKAGSPLGLAAAPEIRAEDFGAVLAKFGIELIAEKIEDEATVVEVLELDVAFGQGHLFGSPRPIRDELIEDSDARGLQTQLKQRLAG